MTQREYRGKDIVTGEWLRGGFYQNSNDGNNWIITHGDMDEYFEASVVDPDTVGQYTGLDDRERNKIFEGDIVVGGKMNCTGGFEIDNERATVTFDKGMFRAGNISLCSFARRCKVISNIHDYMPTPEEELIL